jgi:hypothetical protein
MRITYEIQNIITTYEIWIFNTTYQHVKNFICVTYLDISLAKKDTHTEDSVKHIVHSLTIVGTEYVLPPSPSHVLSRVFCKNKISPKILIT